MYKSKTLPNINECIKRRVYKLRSRNLSYGVWNGKDGFIGIRTKFGDKFLDIEFHWDVGHGTVMDAVDTGIDVPGDIPAVMYLDTIDESTKRSVAFARETETGNKGWYFKDTGTPDETIIPVSVRNKRLFDFLDSLTKDDSNENKSWRNTRWNR
jgi:hypothetical protein